MIKKIKLDKILKNNPSVSKKNLADIDRLARKISEIGIGPRGYQLAFPHKRNRAKVEEFENFDPRTINLSS